MIACGVDPGLSGAIACICSARGLLERASLPTMIRGAGKTALVQRKLDADALRNLITTWSIRHRFAEDYVVLVVELIQPFQASPAVLVSMGYSAGIIEGVLKVHADQFLNPLPRQWKKQFGLTAVKRDSVREAQRRYPHIGRVSDDQAEAILLAQWGLGQVNGVSALATEADPFARAA